ncbi:MAG TPA: hypothetical protein VE690_21240, partial [Rhodopila sp.]|nr:hypothetical protein [Rhodopila sp.]
GCHSGRRVSVYRHHRWMEERPAEDGDDRQTANLLGIIVVLLVLICCLFLVQQLRSRARMEDCILSGRTDCASTVVVPIDAEFPG